MGARSTKAKILRWLVFMGGVSALISGIGSLILNFWRMGECSTNSACKWHQGMPWTYHSYVAFPLAVLIFAVLSLLVVLVVIIIVLVELCTPRVKLNVRVMWSVVILLIVSGVLFLITWILYIIWSDYQGGYPAFSFWFWVMANINLFLSAPVYRLAMKWDEQRGTKRGFR
ncbi:hypothetical protein BOX15_Mlig025084g1 [Macrostomum lignano]|uniref:Uncharacterized protein n=2 Tax=Macrostomum lignano TaxID=282301 RepID=A0A267GL81_9PLAT|nr:hypothetical protein BOX15_Mlig025084g1 [Macrostomum lignano]